VKDVAKMLEGGFT